MAFGGEHRVGGGTSALVRQMHEINADHHLEQFCRQMQIGAAAARCVIELARLILRKDDEFLYRARGDGGVDHDDVVGRGEQVEGGEILDRVILQLRDRGRNGERPDEAEQYRIAIRGRLGRSIGRDDAAAARAIVHDHLLSEGLGEPAAEQARQQIHAAPGREGHEQSQRPRWIVGCSARRRRRAQQRQQYWRYQAPCHFHQHFSLPRTDSITLQLCLKYQEYSSFFDTEPAQPACREKEHGATLR